MYEMPEPVDEANSLPLLDLRFSDVMSVVLAFGAVEVLPPRLVLDDLSVLRDDGLDLDVEGVDADTPPEVDGAWISLLALLVKVPCLEGLLWRSSLEYSTVDASCLEALPVLLVLTLECSILDMPSFAAPCESSVYSLECSIVDFLFRRLQCLVLYKHFPRIPFLMSVLLRQRGVAADADTRGGAGNGDSSQRPSV